MAEPVEKKTKSRIIVKKGIKNFALRIEDIVLFFVESKVVFAMDNKNNKYSTDRNLSELQSDLDPEIFFRVNRKYLVNINYIKAFQPYHRVKLMLELDIDYRHEIIVSQSTAPEFRRWISEA